MVLACVVTALPFAIHAMVQALYGGVAADLRDSLEAGAVGLGIVTAAFGVPGVLLQPMAGALVDRLGVRRTMTVATLGYGCCCARLVMGACLVFRARWTWVGCCMLFTLCCGLGASVNALSIDAAVRAVPRESAGSRWPWSRRQARWPAWSCSLAACRRP